MAAHTLLIPLWRDEIAPRFDLAGEVLLVSLDEDLSETARATILLAHSSAEELCRMALEEPAAVVICNGIEEDYWQYLRWKRVEVLDNVMGPAEAAVERWRQGRLRSGDILFDRTAPPSTSKASTPPSPPLEDAP